MGVGGGASVRVRVRVRVGKGDANIRPNMIYTHLEKPGRVRAPAGWV